MTSQIKQLRNQIRELKAQRTLLESDIPEHIVIDTHSNIPTRDELEKMVQVKQLRNQLTNDILYKRNLIKEIIENEPKPDKPRGRGRPRKNITNDSDSDDSKMDTDEQVNKKELKKNEITRIYNKAKELKQKLYEHKEVYQQLIDEFQDISLELIYLIEYDDESKV
jgi:uncharacterized coiled-coil DUF342 family protein